MTTAPNIYQPALHGGGNVSRGTRHLKAQKRGRLRLQLVVIVYSCIPPWYLGKKEDGGDGGSKKSDVQLQSNINYLLFKKKKIGIQTALVGTFFFLFFIVVVREQIYTLRSFQQNILCWWKQQKTKKEYYNGT